MIAKAGEPFTEGEVVSKCMLQAAHIVCPEKKCQFNNISLSSKTVAERISDLSSDIYDQLYEKANVSLHIRWLVMRPQISQTLPS